MVECLERRKNATGDCSFWRDDKGQFYYVDGQGHIGTSHPGDMTALLRLPGGGTVLIWDHRGRNYGEYPIEIRREAEKNNPKLRLNYC